MLEIDTYQNRPTRAIISLGNLRNNLSVVKSFISTDVKIMGVVKADAYGHGILEVARALLEENVYCLGVAYLEEALFLRKNNITCPIVVLGAINTEQIEDFIENDIEINACSLEKAKAISLKASEMGKKAILHLKIDTGMERIGVHWYNAIKFIEESYALPNIYIKGIFSHFASADTDRKFTKEQIKRFNEILEYLDRKNLRPELVHMANSAGIISYPEAHYNMVRPGIILYGYSTEEAVQQRLKPVMSLKTKVSFFKVAPKDTGIGYGHTYRASEQTRIITLPIGYGDGYRRHFSNKGEVMINGKKYPVVGNVCMDQIMVDIGSNGTAYNNDDVLLFGEHEGNTLDLNTLATAIGAITYEILCGISKRVPRIYVDK